MEKACQPKQWRLVAFGVRVAIDPPSFAHGFALSSLAHSQPTERLLLLLTMENNNSYLSSLLADPVAASVLLGNSNNLSADLAGSDLVGNGANSGLLQSLALLRQQQAEREQQQKLLLAQQIQALTGLSHAQAQLKATENAITLALLRRQQQEQEILQLQQLQGLEAPNANPVSGPSSSPREDHLDSATALAVAGLAGLASGSDPNEKVGDDVKLKSSYPHAASSSAAAKGQLLSRQQGTSLPLPTNRSRRGRRGTFPQKLHQVLMELEREGANDIASFLPHGRAFIIHKPRDFSKYVMPKYFGKMSKFSSFQRQLNLYDFVRRAEGPDKGAYFHELFVRDQPGLCTMMKRNKIKGVKNLGKIGHPAGWVARSSSAAIVAGSDEEAPF